MAGAELVHRAPGHLPLPESGDPRRPVDDAQRGPPAGFREPVRRQLRASRVGTVRGSASLDRLEQRALLDPGHDLRRGRRFDLRAAGSAWSHSGGRRHGTGPRSRHPGSERSLASTRDSTPFARPAIDRPGESMSPTGVKCIPPAPAPHSRWARTRRTPWPRRSLPRPHDAGGSCSSHSRAGDRGRDRRAPVRLAAGLVRDHGQVHEERGPRVHLGLEADLPPIRSTSVLAMLNPSPEPSRPAVAACRARENFR